MLNPLQRRPQGGFRLAEIVLVVSIIAMLGTNAMPNYPGSRRRSHAPVGIEGMRALESAMSLYSMEQNCSGPDAISEANIPNFPPYIKTDSKLYQLPPNDILRNSVSLSKLDSSPKLSSGTFTALSESVPAEFCSPYYP